LLLIKTNVMNNLYKKYIINLYEKHKIKKINDIKNKTRKNRAPMTHWKFS